MRHIRNPPWSPAMAAYTGVNGVEMGAFASIRVVPPSLRSLVGDRRLFIFAEVPLDTAKISAQAHSRSVKNVAVLRIFLRDT